jgi:methyl-accepting chemotaxis protein
MTASGSGLQATALREQELMAEHQNRVYTRSSRMFAILMPLQWAAGVAAAIWISPRAWSGTSSYIHPHVWR